MKPPRISKTWWRRCAIAAAVLPAGAMPAAPQDDGSPPDVDSPTYQTHAQLTDSLKSLAAANPDRCELESIGVSREGREIWALRLAGDGPVPPDSRPALLIAANIDGDHLVGSATCLGVAGELLSRTAAGDEATDTLLAQHCIYVVPRVNPDAAERCFAQVKRERGRNARPDDADRDGAMDEDPPNDLNGDGLITMMRVFDPEKADQMANPDAPRLNLPPDRDRGQRAEFTIYTEGIDDDGDGQFNEDDIGGVDLDLNFMHGYPEHADGAGPYPVSEPESLALLGFVLSRQNIAAVLVYGRHDSLSKTPDGQGTHPAGTPKNIDPQDKGLYEYVGERYREITGLESVPGADWDGSFFAWAYAQFGVPSFSTPLWTRPKGEDGATEAPRPAAPGGSNELTPSGIGDISQETIDELIAAASADDRFEMSDEFIASVSPQMIERFAERFGVEVRRVSKGAASGSAQLKDEMAWLAYSDEQRDGVGFVPWEDLDHPDLGRVQIGGWAPHFKLNPPETELAQIVDKQTAFVLALGQLFPEVSLDAPEVTRLAPGLFDVKTALVNDGYLPTGTAMAVRSQRARPHVVRVSVPPEQIVTGRRVNKVWSIPGSGGRESFRWIVQAEDDTDLTITVYSEKYGRFETTVKLSGPRSPTEETP